jgi:hypothetical protein
MPAPIGAGISAHRSLRTLNRLHITIVVHDEPPAAWNSAGVDEPE